MATFTTNPEPDSENQGVLASWKGIAGYFGCNVRTAKRWERERGLPVHRAPGKKGSTVFARATELDAWLELGKGKHRLNPALLNGDMAGPQADVAEKNPRIARPTTLLCQVSSGQHQAKPTSFSQWQPWILAASVFLVFAATLFWKSGNRQTAAAITPLPMDDLESDAAQSRSRCRGTL